MSEAVHSGLSIIADRYASAMIDVADKKNALDLINSDLYLVKDVINSSKELMDFTEHPLISSEEKKDALVKIFGENISEYSVNLIKILADKNRLLILPFIADYYNKLLCKKRNIDTAEVITAVEIDEDIKNRVKEKLEKLFQKQIKINSKVERDIIAGMIVKIGDKVIDGSIKTKFENMKKQLC